MQYLICRIGKENFAFEALKVEKIARSMPVTRLPYVASYIDGLVNIDGDVIVQLNLRRLMDINHDKALNTNTLAGELVVVSSGNFPVALLVDSALEKVDVDEDAITRLGQSELADRMGVQSDYLTAEIHLGDERCLVFQIESLTGLVRPAGVSDGEAGFLARNRERVAAGDGQRIACMTFSLGDELFALPLVSIQEIVEIASFRKLPQAPESIVGIASLRAQPVLVLAMSELLGLPGMSATGRANPVIMVPHGNGCIGLMVDRLCGIRNFSREQMKKEESNASLVDAYVIDSDQQLTLLLDIARLSASSIFVNIDPYIPRVRLAVAEKIVTTVKLLRVKLANELCAIPVEHVVRLLEYRNATRIEADERGIIGTVDMDGRIIPLLNINKRINVRNDDCFDKLVVIEYGKREWALCVSEAQMLFDLDVTQIDDCSRRESVSGIASHNGELVSILDFGWLLSATSGHAARKTESP